MKFGDWMKTIVASGLVGATLTLATVAPARQETPGQAAQAPAGKLSPTAAGAGQFVTLRPLSTKNKRIVDDLGRDVLLRGSNVNSLGEYWQGVPSLSTTFPMTDADWDLMEANGFSVIRLIITWSRVEPTRGTIDYGYLDQVDSYVKEAAARGIYTMLDMHQDAFSAFIYTTDPSTCPAGTKPAKGWDGAPAWASITDGLSTCLENSERNSSPAVTRAWNNFYDNRDGIRDSFADMWGAVANHFKGRPEIAGFDLLNEPEVSAPAAEITPKYEELIRKTGQAIISAQASAPFRHTLFVEPAIPAGKPEYGLVIPDAQRIGLGTESAVAAAHNYAESITGNGVDLTIEAMMGAMVALGEGQGLPTWIGEYGFWDTNPDTLAKVARYAKTEDDYALGGAWWGWRQSCGDPHAVQWEGGTVISPPVDQYHLNGLLCPGNTDVGPTEPFLKVLSRSYPRAVPGKIDKLTSDPETGHMTVNATASASDVDHEIVVWTPTVDDADHKVSVVGLSNLKENAVEGGRIITATVSAAGAYDLVIGPRATTPSHPEAPQGPQGPAPAATPIKAKARYTG